MNKLDTWSSFVKEDFPALAPIVATEIVGDGWRGLTADGEIYNVDKGKVPESVMVVRAGMMIGTRQVARVNGIDIARYMELFSTAVAFHRRGDDQTALQAINAALAVVDTSRARFNRAMILLALGYWPEGFTEFELCERLPPFQRPASRAALDAKAQPWNGEDVAGKRLLLVHDHGLGDTIMMLRFVAQLQAMDADITMFVPPELTRIASQFGIVSANSLEVAAQACDYFTSFLHLLHWLAVTPSNVPSSTPVTVDPTCAARWHNALPKTSRRRVGVAWSVGVEHYGDFPRSLLIADMAARFGDVEYHSLQVQDQEAAREVGVICHDFADLADCGALMSCMDEVISVDTAAIHLAGAIGHPCATLLLSKWHSWRWYNNPFYPGIKILPSGR